MSRIINRLIAAAALIAVSIFSAGSSSAQLWPPLSGGGGASGSSTPVVFVGATAGSTNAYTIASPTPTGYALVNQYVIRTTINVTNTAASTLNVSSTGALPIVTNAANGLAALVGGELVSGLEYDFTYSTSAATACGSSCYIMAVLPLSAVVSCTSQTITASQWGVFTLFPCTTASQTLTLPASSGLSANGGLVILTVGQSVTLAPNAADAINGGSAGSSVTIASGLSAIVVKSSAGNISVQPTTAGTAAALAPTMIAARWVALSGTGGQAVAGSVFVNNTTTFCFPGVAQGTFTVGALGAYIQTAGTTNFQLALYNSGSWGRPSTLIQATANILNTSTTAKSATITNSQLTLGTVYWLCTQNNDATAVFRTISNSNLGGQTILLGGSTLANATFPTPVGVSTSSTFGTWPTWTSGTTWTDDTSPITPFVVMQIASVPQRRPTKSRHVTWRPTVARRRRLLVA